MKTLTKENAQALITWFENEGQSNWGTWGNYPTLPVGATYLQYDTNACQINFDQTVEINGGAINCISVSRHTVGKKWDKSTSFEALKEWAIEGYAEAKRGARSNVDVVNAAKFDALPSELKVLWIECVGKSNNQRKLALNQKLKEFDLHVSAVDTALIGVGRRAESGYNI